jgi:hypothetical protein
LPSFAQPTLGHPEEGEKWSKKGREWRSREVGKGRFGEVEKMFKIVKNVSQNG